MTARRFGDFELQHRVGRDGPFLIFHARQVSLGRSVILKILPERTATLERAALLRREAEAADKLGGQFRLAGLQPRRAQILDLLAG